MENGVDWYASQFVGEAKLVGEASPDYTKFPRHAGVPARMHTVLPDARLVYVVRDPIERLISHYVDAYSFGRVHRPLNDALDDDEGRHYVACSKYFFQIEQYLPFYDPERILVVQTEALASRRPRRCRASSRSSAPTRRSRTTGSPASSCQRGEHRRKSRVGYAAVRLRSRCEERRSDGGFPRRSRAPSMRSIPPPQSPWRSPSSPRSGGRAHRGAPARRRAAPRVHRRRARRLVSLTEAALKRTSAGARSSRKMVALLCRLGLHRLVTSVPADFPAGEPAVGYCERCLAVSRDGRFDRADPGSPDRCRPRRSVGARRLFRGAVGADHRGEAGERRLRASRTAVVRPRAGPARPFPAASRYRGGEAAPRAVRHRRPGARRAVRTGADSCSTSARGRPRQGRRSGSQPPRTRGAS